MRLFGKHEGLPMPPLEMRRLVGPTEECFFDNPAGEPVYPELPPDAYRVVFDFGCGCGRIARMLIQQRLRPERYVGVDLHRGMIRWCQRNLAPCAPGFEFHHADVFNPGLNPHGRHRMLSFPVENDSVTLVIAHSVFTHLNEEQAAFYLAEARRILRPEGVMMSSWFLFDKVGYPMMQEWQNALFINDTDWSNAVIFDMNWLWAAAVRSGLTLQRIVPPAIRGFQWVIWMAPRRPDSVDAAFPPDLAAPGVARPPVPSGRVDRVGLDE